MTESKTNKEKTGSDYTVATSHRFKENDGLGRFITDEPEHVIKQITTTVSDHNQPTAPPTSLEISINPSSKDVIKLECPIQHGKGGIYGLAPYYRQSLEVHYGKEELEKLVDMARVEAADRVKIATSPAPPPYTVAHHHQVTNVELADNIRHGLTEACKKMQEKLR